MSVIATARPTQGSRLQRRLTNERLRVRFVALGALTTVVPADAHPWPLLLAGWALALAGATLALWSVVVFKTHGRGTPNPQLPPQTLVTRGPYRVSRNPMVVGATALLMVILPLGWALKAGLVIANPGGCAQMTAIAGDAAWHKVALLRLPIAVALFGLAALA